jgi:hypothetical protein
LVASLEGLKDFKGIGGKVGYKPFNAKDPMSRQGTKEIFIIQCLEDGKAKKLTDWFVPE